MTQRDLLVTVLAATSMGLGCDGGGTDGLDIPNAPQLVPNSQSGVVGFELVKPAFSSSVDAVFINGGRRDLVVDLGALRIEGAGAAAFSLGTVIPATGIVESRDALGVPLTFTAPGRGVFLGTLVVESNAENYPEYRLELVGPGSSGTTDRIPDFQFFEDPVPVEDTGFVDVPTALVRYYNLGGRGLTVTSYTLSDPTVFAFLVGTAQPGAACTYDAICGPEDGAAQGCCEGGLDCACLEFEAGTTECLSSACEPVAVAGGQFNILGVTWAATAPATGTHSTVLTMTWSCPTCQEADHFDPPTRTSTVTISGTR